MAVQGHAKLVNVRFFVLFNSVRCRLNQYIVTYLLTCPYSALSSSYMLDVSHSLLDHAHMMSQYTLCGFIFCLNSTVRPGFKRKIN